MYALARCGHFPVTSLLKSSSTPIAVPIASAVRV
jgi:hypothetical protein